MIVFVCETHATVRELACWICVSNVTSRKWGKICASIFYVHN